MRIGELARLSGVPTKTIRYYEGIGLLPEPQREANGYRAYGPEAEERLRFVRDAQSTGLTLTEVGWILELRSRGESPCAHVVDLLEAHLSDLDRQIRRLQRTRRSLATLTRRAQALDPDDCVDSIRCQTIAASTESKKRDAPRARRVPPIHHTR